LSKGNSNVLDHNTFDEIYLRGIQAGERMASSPDQRYHYFKGFNQAIILFDQYILEEQIPYSEIKLRLKAIMEVMQSDGKPNKNKNGNFGGRRAPLKKQPERLPNGRFKLKK
tara:strand:- start:188 stop:523 length:336 start_codon:yes stop_codon:yes gene_type:complete